MTVVQFADCLLGVSGTCGKLGNLTSVWSQGFIHTQVEILNFADH